MDKDVEKRIDGISEHEIARGYRTKELPKELRTQLEGYQIPVFTHFRLTRMNPKRRRSLNETVQRKYHRDLNTPDILSDAQIMKLVTTRGEWGAEQEARIVELQRNTNASMSEMYLDGFGTDTSEWASDILEQADRWREILAASDLSDDVKFEVTAYFDRWIEYGPEKRAAYTAAYAASQNREEYSPDADAMYICEHLSDIDAINCVHQLESLLDKVTRFVVLSEHRQELAGLQLKKARIFSDSVESRRENTEEMARLYFTCERIVNDMPAGALMPEFDGLWELPDDVIQYLLIESYFFHNGIPDEARPYLETFGFIRAEPGQSDASATAMPSDSSDSAPSDVSLAPQNSSSDLPVAAAMA